MEGQAIMTSPGHHDGTDGKFIPDVMAAASTPTSSSSVFEDIRSVGLFAPTVRYFSTSFSKLHSKRRDSLYRRHLCICICIYAAKQAIIVYSRLVRLPLPHKQPPASASSSAFESYFTPSTSFTCVPAYAPKPAVLVYCRLRDKRFS